MCLFVYLHMRNEATQRSKRWLLGRVCLLITVVLVAVFFVSVNWWRVSFRESAVVGLSETELHTRFGSPDYDSRRTPYDKRLPVDEAERLELGLDDDNAFDFVWITGFGGSHVINRLENGKVVGVDFGSHR